MTPWGSSSSSPAMQRSRPWMRAMPSPTRQHGADLGDVDVGGEAPELLPEDPRDLVGPNLHAASFLRSSLLAANGLGDGAEQPAACRAASLRRARVPSYVRPPTAHQEPAHEERRRPRSRSSTAEPPSRRAAPSAFALLRVAGARPRRPRPRRRRCAAFAASRVRLDHVGQERDPVARRQQVEQPRRSGAARRSAKTPREVAASCSAPTRRVQRARRRARGGPPGARADGPELVAEREVGVGASAPATSRRARA